VRAAAAESAPAPDFFTAADFFAETAFFGLFFAAFLTGMIGV
jgi:hypothetical protein